MSKYSNNGKKHNHELLSPCTKDSVRRVLAAEHRTSCLARTKESYCGDGVVRTAARLILRIFARQLNKLFPPEFEMLASSREDNS